MPSTAYTHHLIPLLDDAIALANAHAKLKTGSPGRQYGLGALNRAIVLACVSAWEAYVEELVRGSLEATRPPGPHLGTWTAHNMTVRAQLGRFHTPNTQNVRTLISDAVGMPDIDQSWLWQNCAAGQAERRLESILKLRHQITHGVNPRPVVHITYASQLRGIFEKLAICTDAAVRNHLVATLGVADPWPA